MSKKLIFCTQKINQESIRRENRRGVEHIIVPSKTLPPDIVMNGGIYPKDEVAQSFRTLNRTPVTVEHPEIDGVFVSASDPEVDFDYRIGAWNENARQLDDGRIAVDKVINVQKALKTEKGKRLLDRIEELEKNSSPRPIHTSVGVFVESEKLDSPRVNAMGQEYTWIARNMYFDHDAILLDSIGAATPEQGTGIGVNSESIKVEHFILNDDEHSPSQTSKLEPEVNTMRELLINKLKELEIEVNAEISDDELLEKYNEAVAPKAEEKPEEELELSVNAELSETVKEQADKIADLESKIQANEDAKLAEQIAQVKSCAKYKDLSEDALKAIALNSSSDFEKMLAESKPSIGIGSTMDVNGEKKDEFTINTKFDDLPE